MKAAPFEYVRASSVGEACALLAAHGADAKPIAGGQSLVPMMAMRLARPSLLVDIHHLGTLATWSRAADTLRLGACLRQRTIEHDGTIARDVPLLGKAIRWVGHAQTRNRGTVGGSMAHADPSAELPLVARVLDATLTAVSSTGERTIAAADFFTGPMSTALTAHEILTEIRFPVWLEARVGCAFAEVAIRHGDFAIVAAAAQLAIDANGRCMRAAIGIGGADSTVRAFPNAAAKLVGTVLEAHDVDDLATTLARAVAPASDLHASADYRRHLVHTLATRTLTAARDEAQRQ